MRTRTIAALSFLIAASGLVACAAPQDGEDAEGQESRVTGGSSAVESPVLFLFDASATKEASPKCAGAMLGAKAGITAKACAKQGMLVGRAADKDGRGTRAKIAKVITPEGPDADIALIELDEELGGTRALLTHLPLRDGYSVHAFAAVDGKGLFAPDTGEASSIKGAILEENATHAVVLPAKGSEICDGDLGAPVCSTTGTQLGGFHIRGTCGLSGLVVGRASGDVAQGAKGCSGNGWRVVNLGRHADFIKQHAPDAFKPLVIDKPILRNFPYVPDGLWSYKTAGKVATCKIETASLAAVATSTASGKITAKVAFSALEENAQPWGRVGIAPKSDPKNVRWFAAKATTAAKGAAFETSFEGAVIADKDGEYLVSFRASANGGEAWIDCDTDGIENGYSPDKALPLTVESAGGTPSGTTPQSDRPDTGYSDPPASPSSSGGRNAAPSGEGEEEESTPKKKASGDGGCSVARPGAATGPSSAMSLAGALVALGMLVRRRGAARR